MGPVPLGGCCAGEKFCTVSETPSQVGTGKALEPQGSTTTGSQKAKTENSPQKLLLNHTFQIRNGLHACSAK